MAKNNLRLVEDDGMDKSKALEAALSQIERNFGKGSIMKLGTEGSIVEIEGVSTGSLGPCKFSIEDILFTSINGVLPVREYRLYSTMYLLISCE